VFTTVEQVKEIVTNLLNKTGRGGFITGVVTSVKPLKIRINQRLEISSPNIYVTSNCIGIDIYNCEGYKRVFSSPLGVGDGVLLLCRPSTLDGTKYILLDKIQPYEEKREVHL